MAQDSNIDEVLGFWFGTDDASRAAAPKRWFTKDAAFDATIRARFGALHESVDAGALAPWIDRATRTSSSVLAYVVVLDQFSRNLHRDSARSFEHDAAAYAATDRAILDGLDRSLGYLERYVLYMPLMHAESEDGQRRSVSTFAKLADEAAADPNAGLFRSALDYAEQHARIVKRFGRFPHRNRLLDRTTTADEASFLLEPGSSF